MKWTNKGHQFDNIAHLLDGKTQMYLYGIGVSGTLLLELLCKMRKYHNWEITIIDGSEKEQSSGYKEFPVFSPQKLKNANKENSFVVICNYSEINAPIMRNIAIENGFMENLNLFDYDFFALTLLSVYMLYRHNKVYLSSLNVLPSTLCNLNCQGCLNFNPFAKKHTTYEYESLVKNVDILFSKVDLFGRFQITGGEPLLYKNLQNLVEHIGENYRNQMLSYELVTNGTLIPSNELCELLKKYDMRVYLDNYQKHVHKSRDTFPKIYDKLKMYGIDVIDNDIKQWFVLTPDFDKPKTCSEAELSDFFTNCGCPWTTLAGNTISACNYAHYAYSAGIIDFYPEEYFDLTSVNENNRAELVEFRCRFNDKGYTELCKRCAGYKNNHNWIEPAVQLLRIKGGDDCEMD